MEINISSRKFYRYQKIFIIFALSFMGISLNPANTAVANTIRKNQFNFESLKNQWPLSLRTKLKKNYSGPKVNPDTFISTIRAICDGRKPSKRKLKKLGLLQTLGFQDQAISEGLLPVSLLYRSEIKKVKKPNGSKVTQYHIQKSPLFIYFPGAFGEALNNQSKRFMMDLNELGYHVAAFPNPLHESFINLKANFSPGDFYKEAQVLYRTIYKLVHYLKKKNMLSGDVYLAGVSYGAFLASIVTSIDIDNFNVIKGGTTLISPPADFGKSIQILDDLMFEMRDFAGMSAGKKLYRFMSVCRGHAPSKMHKYAKGVAVYGGFQERLVESIEAYRETHYKDDIPFYDDDWQLSMNFQKYFEWYAPELNKRFKSPSAKLSTWVNKANRNGRSIRILTAKDDWLNSANSWTKFNPANLLSIERGGHYGYYQFSWFNQVITGLYNQEL